MWDERFIVERVADLTEVRLMAQELIAIHLRRSPEPWTFRFDHARKRGGVCNHKTHTISMSKYLCELWSLEECEQVMLHEIAHALAPSDHRHTKVWLDIARSIGYTGKTTHTNPIATHKAPWIGYCPAGHEYHRFRKPYHRKESCPKCHRGYSDKHRIVWEFQG
jgi:predicted SprT family Zn-dependent metalloprotease